MKAKLPKDRNTKIVLAIENFSIVVLKARMMPAALIAPKRMDMIHTITRRVVIGDFSPLCSGK
jgi:hypothetical protein